MARPSGKKAVTDAAFFYLSARCLSHQDSRLSIYKLTGIEDRTAHDLVAPACDVCPNKLIPHVLHEWRESRHKAFALRNAWSLFNSFIEALNGNLIELPRRTEALHGLLDSHVGLDAPSLIDPPSSGLIQRGVSNGRKRSVAFAVLFCYQHAPQCSGRFNGDAIFDRGVEQRRRIVRSSQRDAGRVRRLLPRIGPIRNLISGTSTLLVDCACRLAP